METSQKHDLRLGAAVRTVMATLALATMLGGMGTGIAQADERGHWDHGRQDDGGRHDDRGRHDARREHRRHERPGYVVEQPRAYYVAPPPVVYEAPEPGINFVFPLNIR